MSAYRILYGPPLERPELYFIGYQPGGGEADVRAEHLSKWPEVNDYVTAYWDVARKMRSLFPLEDLRKSMATNAIFFRSPNVETWRSNPPAVRIELEELCRQENERMLAHAKPTLIIALGFTTLIAFMP